ncbi:MAG: hypothetical protein ACM31C_09725, partial [Acidobacteriota bacterium]
GAPAAPHYPLHPSLRSASGGPVELFGELAHPGAIPYAPGITLTCALRLAGGTTRLAADVATLERGDRRWLVPVREIVDGTAPDLELAPGDVVTINAIE